MKRSLFIVMLFFLSSLFIGVAEGANDRFTVYWRVYVSEEDKSYVMHYNAETKEYGKILIPNGLEWLDATSSGDGIYFIDIKEPVDEEKTLFTADIFCVKQDRIDLIKSDLSVPNPETQKLKMEGGFPGDTMIYLDGDLYFGACIVEDIADRWASDRPIYLIRYSHNGEMFVYDVTLPFLTTISPEASVAMIASRIESEEEYLQIVRPDGTEKFIDLPAHLEEIHPSGIEERQFQYFTEPMWMDEQHIMMFRETTGKSVHWFLYGTPFSPIESYEYFLLSCDLTNGEVLCVLDEEGDPIVFPSLMLIWAHSNSSYNAKSQTLAVAMRTSGHMDLWANYAEAPKLKHTDEITLFSLEMKEMKTIFRCGYEPVDEGKWMELIQMRYGTATSEAELLEDESKMMEWEQLKNDLEQQNTPIYIKELGGKECTITSPPVIVWG